MYSGSGNAAKEVCFERGLQKPCSKASILAAVRYRRCVSKLTLFLQTTRKQRDAGNKRLKFCLVLFTGLRVSALFCNNVFKPCLPFDLDSLIRFKLPVIFSFKHVQNFPINRESSTKCSLSGSSDDALGGYIG